MKLLIFESFQAYTLSNQPIDLIDNFDEPTEIIIEAIVEPTEQPSAPSGGGGSGGNDCAAGGSGGSGIVIIRYKFQ